MTKKQKEITEITKAEFARRMNISKSHLTQMCTAGKIPVNKNGKIDFEPAQRLMLATTKDNMGGRPKKLKPRQKDNSVKISYGDDLSNEDIVKIEVELKKAKLSNEQFRALTAELEYKEKERKLISIDELSGTIAEVGSSMRENFLTIGSKLAGSLVGKTAAEIREAIDDEVNEILTTLYKMGGGLIDE